MLLVILVAVLGGGVPTFSKIALEVFPTHTFIFLRFMIAAVVLTPIIFKSKVKISKENLINIFLVSLLGTGDVMFLAFGIKLTTATISQLLYAAVPIIATIASVIILKLKVSKKKVFGIILGFIGVTIIVLVPGAENINNKLEVIIGSSLVLVAVVSYSLYTVFSKRLQDKFSPLQLTVGMIFTTIIIQLILIPTEISKYKSIIDKVSYQSILGIIYVGLIGTAVYFLLYQQVIKKTNPLYASMILYLQPVFTFLWSVVLLGEGLNYSIIIGSLFALVGACLVTAKDVNLDLKNRQDMLL